MGGVKGKAGYPVGGEEQAAPGSGAVRQSRFERGVVYWSPEHGSLYASARMRFWLTGLYTHDESDEWSDEDEPYVSVGVVAPGGQADAKTTPVFDVNAGTRIHHEMLAGQSGGSGLEGSYELFFRIEPA